MSFDPLVANAGRLGILTALAAAERQEFAQLRRQTRLTDGNLASHAKRLRSAGMIDVDKAFRDGKPVTSYTLTATGRAALEAHVRRLLESVRLPEHAATPRDDSDAGSVDEPLDPVQSIPPAPVTPAAVAAHDDTDDDDWID